MARDFSTLRFFRVVLRRFGDGSPLSFGSKLVMISAEELLSSSSSCNQSAYGPFFLPYQVQVF